jgi:hypothetical protein
MFLCAVLVQAARAVPGCSLQCRCSRHDMVCVLAEKLLRLASCNKHLLHILETDRSGRTQPSVQTALACCMQQVLAVLLANF